MAERTRKEMNIGTALSSLGAVGGIAYGVSKQKSFWTTAGFAILFAIGGSALGIAYQSLKPE
jgi:hypothetical protein